MSTSPETLVLDTHAICECFDRLIATKAQSRPLSTYRLQFHKGFRLTDAQRIIPYLQALGITHVYASPILEARAGSTHGYDIIHHNRLNPEIGTEEEFLSLTRELAAHGMGLILDIVPNHMGVGTATPWWRDVLENGRTSAYADFFDIDWEPLKPELRNKLLLPVLSAQYGAVLEDGRLQLELQDGNIVLRYFDHSFPIDPQTLPLIFDATGEGRTPLYASSELQEFGELLERLRSLPLHTTSDPGQASERRERWRQIKPSWINLLQSSGPVQQFVQKALRQINGKPGDPRSFDMLHLLLELQVYRLAFWRVSGEEINYRRFFDVNDLVGIKMENPEVFAATHKLVRRLLAEGTIQGLRIDHCDGMFNPRQYLIRLQMLYAASQCSGSQPVPPLAENGIELDIQRTFGQHPAILRQAPLYVLVEKILEPGEELPDEWPVDGTSGYEFTNLVNGILIQQKNEREFSKIYHRFINGTADVEALIYNSKKLIMHSALSSEVNVLTNLLAEVSTEDRRARDFTLKTLRDAIRETIACFPVYRTYIDERGEYTERDQGYIQRAIARAKRLNAGTAEAVFDFLQDTLLLRDSHKTEDEAQYRRKLYFALKFQQLTGPVMAKGLEDTVCYVYNRFVSLNEVGGSPRYFGISVQDFHAANARRAARWPNSMLATSTHDTKRGEDVRARLNVLSEMPQLWSAHVFRARRINQTRLRTISDGRTVPDLNESYLLYQTLVGVWPWNIADPAQREDLTKRVQAYMSKALHEAKVNLSWINQNPEYVQAMQDFLADILSAKRRENPFVSQMEQFMPPVAFFGAINSLAQTVLKLTSPGSPDIYQGTDLWDFSLVDPDNRRPVDYDTRQEFMKELCSAQSGDLNVLCEDLLRNYHDGRIKLWTIMRTSRLRRNNPELFRHSTYVPLEVTDKQEHVCAFMRHLALEQQAKCSAMITVVPRLSYTLMRGKMQAPLGEVWEGAELTLPENLPSSFENLFTGERLNRTEKGTLLCREIFARFPVAVLVGV
jgi:(1->4)-alpha-D-glucan 1-alpha-D-glucosylmutase